MNILYSNLQKATLFFDSHALPINDFVVDRSKGLVVAFLLDSGQYVRTEDIFLSSSQKLQVRGQEQLPIVKKNDINELLAHHVALKGLSVVYKSGKRIGRLADVEFETTFFDIVRYIVKPQLTRRMEELLLHIPYGENLIIPKSAIISIEKDQIIVDDQAFQEKKISAGLVRPRILDTDAS